jgi:hypothetical protein
MNGLTLLDEVLYNRPISLYQFISNTSLTEIHYYRSEQD